MAGASERKARLREQLISDREAFLAAAALSPEELARRVWTEGGDWTAQDLIGHVAYAEEGMVALAQAGASGQPTRIPDDFDIDRYNAGRMRRARAQSAEQLLERLAAARAAGLALLDSLDDDALDRPVQHATQGATTVEGVFQIIAGHDRLHAADLRRVRG